MRRRYVMSLAALLIAGTGCKFSEQVTAPPGEPTVIAQMILNTTAPVQVLLLERSDGGTSRAPLAGATVRLTHLNPDASCAQPVVTLGEVSDTIIYGLTGEARHTYQTSALCPLHPGDRIALRVETPQGEVVTGTTQIPGMGNIAVSAGAATVGFAPATLALDRTRDSVRVVVDPRFARGLQIEALRKGGNPRRGPSFNNLPTGPTFDVTTDTMHATVAGNLVDPFADNGGQTIFRAGVNYLFAFATTDTNYFDFVRSGANPFTGRGFINHLSGGIGVFGSVFPQTYEVRITAPQADPREGIYRVFGRLTGFAGINVDVNLDLYLDALSKTDAFSALMDGTWVEGPAHSSVDGQFGDGFHAQFYGMPADPLATVRPLYEIDYTGPLPPRGTPFKASLTAVVFDGRTFDQVTVVQLSGP